jgi:hypothetical protein
VADHRSAARHVMAYRSKALCGLDGRLINEPAGSEQTDSSGAFRGENEISHNTIKITPCREMNL